MKTNNRRGISLIVLVITIIVIIILAVAVILTIANNNPIENARKARFVNDLSAIQDEVTLEISKRLVDNPSTYKAEYFTTANLDSLSTVEGTRYKDNLTVTNGKIGLKAESEEFSEKEKTWIQEAGYILGGDTTEQLIVNLDFTNNIASANIDQTAMTLKIVDEENNVTKIPIGNNSIASDGSYQVFYIGKGNASGYEIKVNGLEKEKEYKIIIVGKGYWPWMEEITYHGNDKVTISDSNQFIAGDLNGDGIINQADTKLVRQKLGTQTSVMDLDRSGIVDEKDVKIVNNNRGKSRTALDINANEL